MLRTTPEVYEENVTTRRGARNADIDIVLTRHPTVGAASSFSARSAVRRAKPITKRTARSFGGA